jgi:3-oxoacyl-[acyl-carrier protein] reductase
MKILITGASSGIGRYLAGRLAGEGHEVWGAARSAQAGPDAALQTGSDFRYSSCNIADWSAVQALRAEVGAAWAGLDGLICCGGIQAPIGRTMEIDPALWSANLRTNLDGTFFAIRAFHDLLLTGRRGNAKVLCFSGGGASSPRPNFSAYACAKAAVVRLVENLSVEWQGSPVDINAIAPGAIPTAMTQEVLQSGAATAGEKEIASAARLADAGTDPLIRAGDLVAYLLSPASDGISGRLISAPWDPWRDLDKHREELAGSDIFTLRRITPEDRQKQW